MNLDAMANARELKRLFPLLGDSFIRRIATARSRDLRRIETLESADQNMVQARESIADRWKKENELYAEMNDQEPSLTSNQYAANGDADPIEKWAVIRTIAGALTKKQPQLGAKTHSERVRQKVSYAIKAGWLDYDRINETITFESLARWVGGSYPDIQGLWYIGKSVTATGKIPLNDRKTERLPDFSRSLVEAAGPEHFPELRRLMGYIAVLEREAGNARDRERRLSADLEQCRKQLAEAMEKKSRKGTGRLKR